MSISSNAQCLDCSDDANVITYNGNGTFTASTAQAYFWEICEGDATIVGSNTLRTITVNCNSTGPFKVKVTRFTNGNCIESCEAYRCSNGVIDPINIVTQLPRIYCIGYNPVVPYDVNSNGKLQYAFVNSVTTVLPPSGITYTWYFKFRDGQLLVLNGQNPQFRELCPQNPVMTFGLIVTNGIETRRYLSSYVSNRIPSQYSIPGFLITDIFPVCSLFGERCGMPLNLDLNMESVKIILDGEQEVIKFLNLDKDEDYSFKLYDLSGNSIINETKFYDNINVNRLNNGIYLYNLIDSKGNVIRGKLIKD